MKFSAAEIELAQKLKADGLSWTPSVGHFVWDQDNLINASSPFHDRVFFILDLKHFLRRSGTIERLAQGCCWLPTWYDAREVLRAFAISDQQVADHLASTGAIAAGTERLELYRLISESLARR